MSIIYHYSARQRVVSHVETMKGPSVFPTHTDDEPSYMSYDTPISDVQGVRILLTTPLPQFALPIIALTGTSGRANYLQFYLLLNLVDLLINLQY